MVGLAFAVAASANFPILFLTITWNRLTTKGAFGGINWINEFNYFCYSWSNYMVEILGFEKAIFSL